MSSSLRGVIVFGAVVATISTVSLVEIKNAVVALSADELAELAAFIRERENREWDRQIDADFAEGGRLATVAEEVRTDIRAGRLQDLRHADLLPKLFQAVEVATARITD
jgi:hypothetical protein